MNRSPLHLFTLWFAAATFGGVAGAAGIVAAAHAAIALGALG